jgi:predicted flap endonuclease-1-like 5' DNA nuclease
MTKANKDKVFRIYGKVVEKQTGDGIPNLTVSAFDKDVFFDDSLGSVRTDKNGNFEIRYSSKDFKELLSGKRPNIYLTVADTRGKVIHSTKEWVRYKAREKEGFLIKIPVRKQLKPKSKPAAKPKPASKATPKAKPKTKAKTEPKKKTTKKPPAKTKGAPLNKIPGIGPSREKKLKKEGISDAAAFSKASDAKLKKILGNVDVKKMKSDADKLLKKK